MSEINSYDGFEASLAKEPDSKYILRLYIAGTSAKSTQAIGNIKRLCEEHLKGRYELEVVDLYQQPILAQNEQIIAVPTLIKKLPLPLRKLIGDFSSNERILIGLDIRPHKDDIEE